MSSSAKEKDLIFSTLRAKSEEASAAKTRARAAAVKLFFHDPPQQQQKQSPAFVAAASQRPPHISNHNTPTTTLGEEETQKQKMMMRDDPSSVLRDDNERAMDRELEDFFGGLGELGLSPPPPSTSSSLPPPLSRSAYRPQKGGNRTTLRTAEKEEVEETGRVPPSWARRDDDDADSAARHQPHTFVSPKTQNQLQQQQQQHDDGDVVTEHIALDDAFTYFPAYSLDSDAPPSVLPVRRNQQPQQRDDSNKRMMMLPQPRPPSSRHHVPGRQVIEPGYVRYRVDVQYHGTDFDGWHKSTEKKTKGQSKTSGEGEGNERSLHPQEDVMGLVKQRAKAALEDALAVALDVDHIRIESGAMPESGVHVRRLTCHFDAPSSIELQPRTILQRATLWLEKKKAPLAILSCQPCENQQFHARHSATRRVYVYRICNRIAPPLFEAGLQWHVDRYLDVDRMSRYATSLEGTHDFGFFADAKMAYDLRKAASISSSSSASALDAANASSFLMPEADSLLSQKNPKAKARGAQIERHEWKAMQTATAAVHEQQLLDNPFRLATTRTLDALRVVRQDDEVLIWFVGKSFLRHQVRSMVSVLRMIGQGLWTEGELREALRVGFEPSRGKAARIRPEPAPAHGLTLWEVEYPQEAHGADRHAFVDSGVLEVPGVQQFDGEVGKQL